MHDPKVRRWLAGRGAGGGLPTLRRTQLAGVSQVKAQVRLRFRDTQSRCHTLVRSVCAVQQQDKVTFKTIDVTLQTAAAGSVRSLTQRCTETDKLVPELLGVSPAMLENVIFCHQDDSSWPMSEPKKLKERFDELFASNRYNEAAENIHGLCKTHRDRIKSLQASLATCEAVRREALETEADIERTDAKIAHEQDAIEASTKELEQLDARRAELDAVLCRAGQIEHDIGTLSSALVEMQKNADERRAELDQCIDEEASGVNLEQLAQQAETAQSEISTKIDHAQHNVAGAEHDVAGLQELCQQQSTVHAQLMERSVQYMSHLRERDRILADLLDPQNARTPAAADPAFDPPRVQVILAEAEARAQALERELDEARAQYNAAYAENEREINAVATRRATLETQSAQIAAQVEAIEGQLGKHTDDPQATIAALIQENHDVAARLEARHSEQRTAEAALESHRADRSLDELRSQLDSIALQRTVAQNHLAAVGRMAYVRAQLDHAHRTHASKMAELQVCQGMCESETVTLLGAPYDPTTASAVKMELDRLDTELRRLVEAEAALQQQSSDVKAGLSHTQAWLTDARTQLKHARSAVKSANGDTLLPAGVSIEQAIAEADAAMEQQRRDCAMLESAHMLYRQFLEEASRTDACPLCLRALSGSDDAPHRADTAQPAPAYSKAALTCRLNALQADLPQQLVAARSALEQATRRRAQLAAAEPSVATCKTLETLTIPGFRTELEHLAARSDALRQQQLATAQERSQAENRFQRMEYLRDRLKAMLSLQKEVADLAARVSSLEAQLGEAGDGSIAETEQQLQQLWEREASVKDTIERKQTAIRDAEHNVEGIKAELSALLVRQTRLKGQLESAEKMLVERVALMQQLDRNQRDFTAVSAQLAELNQARTEEQLQAARQQLHRAFGADNNRRTERLQELRRAIERSKECMKRLAQPEYVDILQLRDDAAHALEQLQNRAQLRQRQLESFKADLAHWRDEMAKCLATRRRIEGNIAYRAKMHEITEQKKALEALQVELRNLRRSDVGQELAALQKKYEMVSADRARSEGARATLHGQLMRLRQKLQQDPYADIHRRYMATRMQLKTVQMAHDDLCRYYTVLDRAIMRFHSIKMQEVNGILKDLWRATYKGNDIDYIEIRSDAESTAGSASNARRSYSYRVVMVKGSTELDARGRCSAGQKVLASLLIRLALAESFSVSCGMIALDEPTANLDRDNIVGLAQALAWYGAPGALHGAAHAAC